MKVNNSIFGLEIDCANFLRGSNFQIQLLPICVQFEIDNSQYTDVWRKNLQLDKLVCGFLNSLCALSFRIQILQNLCRYKKYKISIWVTMMSLCILRSGNLIFDILINTNQLLGIVKVLDYKTVHSKGCLQSYK